MESLVDTVILESLLGTEEKRYSDEEYFFFLEFFRYFHPYLVEEYETRVANSMGYIDWDFVVGPMIPIDGSNASLQRRQKLQYRAVLEKIISELQGMDHYGDESLLLEKQSFIEMLRNFARKIIKLRDQNLNRHEMYQNKSKNDKRKYILHEEVLDLWRKIIQNISFCMDRLGINYEILRMKALREPDEPKSNPFVKTILFIGCSVTVLLLLSRFLPSSSSASL